MESQNINKDNQWIKYLEQGKQPEKAIKPKQIIDVRKALKAKYPNTPMPSPNRIIRTVAPKQQRAIITQQGAR